MTHTHTGTPAHTHTEPGQDQDEIAPAEIAPSQVLDACREDCTAARQAIREEREIHEGQHGCWRVEFWQIPAPGGEIRLTWAGGAPHGRVSPAFQRQWWLAVADMALDEARRLAAEARL